MKSWPAADSAGDGLGGAEWGGSQREAAVEGAGCRHCGGCCGVGVAGWAACGPGAVGPPEVAVVPDGQVN